MLPILQGFNPGPGAGRALVGDFPFEEFKRRLILGIRVLKERIILGVLRVEKRTDIALDELNAGRGDENGGGQSAAPQSLCLGENDDANPSQSAGSAIASAEPANRPFSQAKCRPAIKSETTIRPAIWGRA